MTTMIIYKASRLLAQDDQHRSVLPIVPVTGNWFVPSVNPNVDDTTNKKISQLIYATSGEVDLNNINSVSDGADIVVTSFP